VISWLRPFAFVAALAVTSPLAAAPAAPIAPEAVRVVAVIDQLDVESHWPAGVHVAWSTGIPDGHAESGEGRHTHCSAFAAAAAQALGIYILRPPEHPQTLLANAQVDWLENEGESHGWHRLGDAVDAQRRANLGALVVAAYRNHHSDKPGHIVILRPSDKDVELIRAEGPQVTQAGEHNYRSTSLKHGFADHPAAWGNSEVVYYAHQVSLR